MRSERHTLSTAAKLTLASLYLFTLTTLTTGCFLGLPRPTVRASKLSEPSLVVHLCPDHQSTTRFTIREDTSLSGVVACRPAGLTIVLLNSFGVRVRTINASSAGELSDEVSYLCPLTNPAEEVLPLIIAAGQSATHETSANGITVRIEDTHEGLGLR